jgi:Uma2 family endonuclease
MIFSPHGTLVPYDLRRLYTVEEFALLPEDNSFLYELQDGVISVSPRPAWAHQAVFGNLYGQVDAQLPADLVAAPAVDLDLELERETARVPDLLVVRAEGLRKHGMQKASDVLLAVEILSPGSVDLDTRIKPMEYADAGIPNWVVDPTPPVTATVHGLYGEDYEESQRAEHTFTVTEPCPLTIDLDALLR